ncbi:unnamed protein product [Adineta steineri]|uniref:Uncharacterized protein n=1 Tax=Adineta steineri TaxID=433720 RepID=A0A815IPT5_9BILA|nr:unnamed protein product [Adineta steineri]
MQKAVGPNDNNSITENSVDKARKLVLRCYNSLASQQELSGAQVGTYLIDYGDHYTSYGFANIFVIAIERHLQNELEKYKVTLASSSTTMQATNTNSIDFIEDEEEETTAMMNEQFSIEQSTDPQNLVLINLRIDYQLRSPALETVCLYEFVSLFHRKSFTDKDRLNIDRPSTSTEDVRLNPGRPLQERYLFMIEHPQAKSHGVIKRLKPIVSVLLGPQIPRKDREETQERYSRAIATLFIPWRSVKDLCAVNQSWREALSSRQESISIESKEIIEHIQLLHDCKKDRDVHLQQIISNVQASDEIDPRLFPRNMRVDDSDGDDDDSNENETYLNFLDSLADNNQTSTINHLSDKEQLYQDEALRSLHKVGRFSNCTGCDQPSMVSTSLSHFSVKTQHSVQQNTAWQAAIKSDALRRRQQSILDDDFSPLNQASNELISTNTTNNITESTTRTDDQVQSVTTRTLAIPTRRQLRTEINNRAAVDKAKEAGIPLIVVVAHDKIRSKISEDDAIYERLLHIPDNKTELLPGLLPFIPNMPVLLTDNIACELGLSNGTQGIFRELIYDDQEDTDGLKIKSEVFPSNTIYIRKPLYALVEINTSQLETSLDGLRPKLIPIPLIKKQFAVSIKQLFGRQFERVEGGKKVPQLIQVTRTQLPIVPAFAITTYKAQGLTMNKIVVDLQVPLGTSQVASVYVPLSRVKIGEDAAILRPFDKKILQVRPSLAQDAELKRLDELDRKTKRECTFFTF